MTNGARSSWDVFMAGPLSSYDSEFINLVTDRVYDRVDKVCVQMGVSCYLPYKSRAYAEKHISPGEVYALGKDAIESSAVVVAYVGDPAIGVGMTIEIAHHAGVPVVLLYEEDGDVSTMALGCPGVHPDDHLAFPNESPSAFEVPLGHRIAHHVSARNLWMADQLFGSQWTPTVRQRLHERLDRKMIAARGQSIPISVEDLANSADKLRREADEPGQPPLFT